MTGSSAAQVRIESLCWIVLSNTSYQHMLERKLGR